MLFMYKLQQLNARRESPRIACLTILTNSLFVSSPRRETDTKQNLNLKWIMSGEGRLGDGRCHRFTENSRIMKLII